MKILVTGPPGSGKTSLVNYAKSLGDERFYDADEIPGLCEWRNKQTNEVLGLVADYPETGTDEWYATYKWCWRRDFLEDYLKDKDEIIICGSANNTPDCFELFDKVFILEKTEEELVANLTNPTRNNPFGSTPEQRKNFMNFQARLKQSVQQHENSLITGNSTTHSYAKILSQLQ